MTDLAAHSLISDQAIESALRATVQRAFALKQADTLTLRSARSNVSRTLSLPDDFFKQDQRWAAKSKEIVHAEAKQQQILDDKSNRDPCTNGTPGEGSSLAEVDVSPQIEKRRSTQLKKISRKRGRKQSSPKLSERTLQPTQEKSDGIIGGRLKSYEASNEAEVDSLSDVNEDIPPRKATKNKKNESSATTKTSAKDSELSMRDEIKKLQSQLVQCGVRKFWSKELAPFATSGEKVDHLKRLLRDVGIRGRFSSKRAKEIREAKELQEELETVVERSKLWGSTEDTQKGKPRSKYSTESVLLSDCDDEESG